MEERRLLLAVALSLVVLTAYSLLFAPAPPPSSPIPSPSATPVAAPARQALPSPPPEAEERPHAPAAVVADERERRVEVQAPDYAVAFTNRGARPVSWTLARYLDGRGAPEEMIPAQTAAVRPLDVETGDPAIDARLRGALYRPSAEAVRVDGAEPKTIRFTWSDGDLTAEKELSFRASGLVGVTVSVTRGGQPVARRLLWGPGVGNATPEEREVRGYEEPSAVALAPRGVETFAAAKLPATGQTIEGVRWVGVKSHYFAALFVAPGGAAGAAVRAVAVPVTGDEKPVSAAVAAIDASEPVQLFVGAKDYPTMAKLGHELERVVQVGDWIGPIVVALMRLLRWVQAHVGNWGWSIVLLTVLINLAMAPFRHYGIVNGLKMAKLSPEMRAIQERYRKLKLPLMDPRRQQMQEEVAALYARHGMSMGSQMAVGCLPLLLTMPFLFAFYRVLAVSIELRGAPFLWIADLAQKDPLFLTPVLMGASMFAMQKMSPSTLDPAQQRIMMLMPVMLAGMFLWAPAGLNLYWLTSNLCSILQQGISMRLLHPDVRPGRDKRAK
ncbi:MAG TPA: membrane protein insertase YidC [Vicinamibacteria bacterium]|nr:membrane protein insertase YidC [Vicinamibacteria bacterium]